MRPTTAIVAMLLLTLVAGFAGGYVGVRYGLRHADSPQSLDTLLHHELDLSATQRSQLTTLEGDFAQERRPLESQLSTAKQGLATAIATEHRYGPRVAQAVDRVHQVMSGLQQLTLQHVLAMRAVLTPAQARSFDATVTKALLSDSP